MLKGGLRERGAIGLAPAGRDAPLDRLAAARAVPVRAFNVFFGLGIPAPLQTEGFQGVLEPLKPLGRQAADPAQRRPGALRREGDQRPLRRGQPARSRPSPPTARPRPAAPRSTRSSARPIIPRACRPAWSPRSSRAPSSAAVGSAGTSTAITSDGTVAATMQEKPARPLQPGLRHHPRRRRRFRRRASRRRLKRSVLDSVVDDYRFYTGANSPLGATSKARIADHLDRIREFEQRAFAMTYTGRLPSRRRVRSSSTADTADPGGQGIDITLDELSVGVAPDGRPLRARHPDGSRPVRFLDVPGGRRADSPDRQITSTTAERSGSSTTPQQLNASGDKGCSHEWWHQFDEKKKNEQLRAHAHMKMREVAYFLASSRRRRLAGSERPDDPRKLADHGLHRIRRRPPQRREAGTLGRLSRHHRRRRAFQDGPDPRRQRRGPGCVQHDALGHGRPPTPRPGKREPRPVDALRA